jgi:hypothetical protein
VKKDKKLDISSEYEVEEGEEESKETQINS